MELWIDAQLSPALALWINQLDTELYACSLRSLGLANANDKVIFEQAKQKKAIIVSKDVDFVKLLERHGPPPQIIWITAGNTSNAQMHNIFTRHLSNIISMLTNGEPLIEIGDI